MGTGAAARKKSKAMKIVLAAIRTLSKAKDFYMMSMEQLGNGVAGNPNPQASTLARSCSVSSAKKASNVVDDQLAALPRSMSESRSKPSYGLGASYVHNNHNHNHNKGLGYGYGNGIIKRSCSVADKKKKKKTMMGRIDEDDSYSVREDDVSADHLLYPRSKSYSVKKSTSYMRLR